MSQDEIISWLQDHPGWHPAKEMIVAVMTAQSIYSGCRYMRKNKRVDYKAGPHGIWLVPHAESYLTDCDGIGQKRAETIRKNLEVLD